MQREWQGLARRSPGERFQGSYWQTHQTTAAVTRLSRLIRIGAAVAAFLIGVCFIFLPLPEFPFFVIGGALLAAESLPFAQFLDRLEIRVRARWTALKRRYRLGPIGGRLLVVAGSLSTLVGSGLLCHAFRG